METSKKGRTMKIFGFPLWVYFLFIATLALGTDEFVISGILPEVAHEFGVTNGLAGILITAFAVAFCLGSPIIAFFTDRFEKRKILSLALLVFAGANVGVAMAHTFELAIVMRVIAGLAAATVSPLCMVIAAGAAPEGSSGRYLALATSGLTVALFTGVPVGAFFADLYDWRATFNLIAVLSVAVSAFLFFFAPSVPGNEQVAISVRLAPFGNGSVRRLVIAMFLCGSGGLMFYNYLGAIVLDEFGSSQEMVVWSLLFVGLTGVLAVFAGGFVVDRFGARPARLLIVGGHSIALLLVGIHMATVGSLDVLFFVLLGCWSVFAWALGPAMQASLMDVAGKQAMLAMSLGISGLYGGSAVGAAVGGILIDKVGAVALPLFGALFVAVAFLLIGFRNEKQSLKTAQTAS